MSTVKTGDPFDSTVISTFPECESIMSYPITNGSIHAQIDATGRLITNPWDPQMEKMNEQIFNVQYSKIKRDGVLYKNLKKYDKFIADDFLYDIHSPLFRTTTKDTSGSYFFRDNGEFYIITFINTFTIGSLVTLVNQDKTLKESIESISKLIEL